MSAEHMMIMTYQSALEEWHADCSCGHVGPYRKLREYAKRDHERHVEATRQAEQAEAAS